MGACMRTITVQAFSAKNETPLIRFAAEYDGNTNVFPIKLIHNNRLGFSAKNSLPLAIFSAQHNAGNTNVLPRGAYATPKPEL